MTSEIGHEGTNGPQTRANRPSTTVASCPLCAHSSYRLVYCLKDYDIARCRKCGVEFNLHYCGGGAEGGGFDETYFLVHQKEAFASYVEDFRRDPSVPMFERRLRGIESEMSPGSLLDVGPGLGTFLCLARDRGWKVLGVDVSQFSARHIRDKHGIEMLEGNLHELACAEESFDLITFWDSIEHVAEPRKDLERAHRLLRPGGLVLLTTDNFDCLVASIAARIYGVSLGMIRYPVSRVFTDKNLTYFSERTFRRFVSEVEFEEVLFDKMEYPLSKISLNFLERQALRLVYFLAWLSHREAQMTLIGRKLT